jgi:hypothetical protein
MMAITEAERGGARSMMAIIAGDSRRAATMMAIMVVLDGLQGG